MPLFFDNVKIPPQNSENARKYEEGFRRRVQSGTQNKTT